MIDLKRIGITVLGSGALFLCAETVMVATPVPQLVITSAVFDEANGRLLISGQNFSWPANGAHAAPPVVSLDLLPLTVLSSSSTEIVASISGTFPEGTYLVTVSRGQATVDNGAFAVAIYHEQPPVPAQGPAGPSGPSGPTGPVGPMGPNGTIGPVGPAGAVGPSGSAGVAGATGPVGPHGADGAVGPVGPAGPAGPIGATGPAGAIGPTGPTGPQGVIGATGPMGPQGVVGPQGIAGVSGLQIVTASASSTNLGNGKFISATAVCPAGTRVLSGGVQQTSSPATAVSASLASTYPDTNQSWLAELRNNQSFSMGAVSIVVYAVCAIAN